MQSSHIKSLSAKFSILGHVIFFYIPFILIEITNFVKDMKHDYV